MTPAETLGHQAKVSKRPVNRIGCVPNPIGKSSSMACHGPLDHALPLVTPKRVHTRYRPWLWQRRPKINKLPRSWAKRGTTIASYPQSMKERRSGPQSSTPSRVQRILRREQQDNTCEVRHEPFAL